MQLVTPTVRDSGQYRDAAPADLLNLGEQVITLNNAAAVTLTAAQLMSGILNRTGPAGAYGDTLPDASSIVSALCSQNGSGANTPQGVNPGSTFRLKVINGGGGLATPVAGANMTLSGTTTIAAASLKDYLITILNGTPSQVLAATTTNASAVITGLSAAQTALLSPGMAVSGAGIAGGSTVLSVQPGVGVTLSANATATGNLIALTFAPRVDVRSLGQLGA